MEGICKELRSIKLTSAPGKNKSLRPSIFMQNEAASIGIESENEKLRQEIIKANKNIDEMNKDIEVPLITH